MRGDPLRNPEPPIRRVYAYTAYRLGDGPEAEDATSDTFERALRYRSSYDPRKGPPVAWLLGIARRCVDDVVAARIPTEGEPEERPAGGDLEGEAATRLDVTAAVAELDERDRELIALRYGADLKASQIAELLGLKTNAVEVAIHRALKRLRERLESREPEDPSQKPVADAV